MLNVVHPNHDSLANALADASEDINNLLKDTDFQFAWEYDGWACFSNQSGSINFAATPGWDGLPCVPVQITDEDGDQIDGTEDIGDIILDEFTIANYVQKVKALLLVISQVAK